MAVPKKITAHLHKIHLAFEEVPHRKVYTAYDLAQTLGEKLDGIAKTLLVKIELPKAEKEKKGYWLVMVPASYRVNLQAVKKALASTKAELMPEKIIKKLGITPGAGTPVASFYDGVGLLMDKTLAKSKKILIRAESFTDSLRVKVKDLIKAEMPIIAAVGEKTKLKLQPLAKPKRKPKKGTNRKLGKKKKKHAR